MALALASLDASVPKNQQRGLHNGAWRTRGQHPRSLPAEHSSRNIHSHFARPSTSGRNTGETDSGVNGDCK